MPSGGYRKPTKPAATSGPGKFSKRTDGQAVQTPGLAGTDLQYGDVQRLEAAQKIAPLPAGVDRPPLNPQRRPEGAPMQRGDLPSYLFETPTALPNTPDTSGLSTGPGGGPDTLGVGAPVEDERETVMDWIYRTYGNADAEQWLIDFRNERAVPQASAGAPQTHTMPDGSTMPGAQHGATTGAY